jgi:hypothetical protein
MRAFLSLDLTIISSQAFTKKAGMGEKPLAAIH